MDAPFMFFLWSVSHRIARNMVHHKKMEDPRTPFMLLLCIPAFLWLVRRKMKPLVILDINGVLLYREYDSKRTDADEKRGRFSIWKRPDLTTFIPRLFDVYHVAVWTSMQKHNTNEMIELVFPKEYMRKLWFIRNQTHCLKLKDKGFYPDKPDRPWFVKKIPWYWFLFFRTIYIVDDDFAKIGFNRFESIVDVPSWTPDSSNFTSDDLLENLRDMDRHFRWKDAHSYNMFRFYHFIILCVSFVSTIPVLLS